MSWTDERVETLKRMWAEGQSASQIAKELGGVTRNAVIGKVHRLGLSNRTASLPGRPDEAEIEAEPDIAAETVVEDPPAEPEPPAAPVPPQPAANEISPEALASVREVEKRARRLTLMELTERTCKWPVGDPATDDFWFCGLPTLPGKPYCEAHVGVAFQPMSARRDRRR
jgi:GcrA cell cycle regulator